MTAEILATAKVNLRLEVLGRSAGGYHQLRTSMVALALGDRVYAEAREEAGLVLSVVGEHGFGVPEDETNLAHRATVALLDHVGHPGGVALELEKRVPAGAGLGGASADAAAALAATRAVLDLGEDQARDEAILSALGSDTVFFRVAVSGHALCEGRGERVTPRRGVGDWSVLLLTPDVHSSTSAVYGAFDSADLKEPSDEAPFFDDCTALEAREHLFNHLESSALALYPELSAWRGVLDSAGLDHARLTGSGASFFALYDSEDEAREALEDVLARSGDLPSPRLACVTAPAGGVSPPL